MNAGLPKQYLPLEGRPLAEHTLRAFLPVDAVREIVVAIATEDTHWHTLPESLRARVRVVRGGRDRTESVWHAICGFSRQPAAHDWVLVHDMARPCLRPAQVERLIETLREDAVGGLLAIPVVDTLKRADAGGRVAATVARGELWHAQTPQMFRFGILSRALREARDQGVACSDESMAVERLGYRPRLVRGSVENLKVTVAEDLELAAYFLSRDHGGR